MSDLKSVKLRHLSFIDYIENFKNYRWVIDVYEELFVSPRFLSCITYVLMITNTLSYVYSNHLCMGSLIFQFIIIQKFTELGR